MLKRYYCFFIGFCSFGFLSTSLNADQASYPKKVAALNWDIAEQVIELGVPPLVMPNIKGYSKWVRSPAVPEGVEDSGTRMEPNYHKLKSLQPDIIFVAGPQEALIPHLEKIAPVELFITYKSDHNNADAAEQNYLRMAKILGRENYARNRLDGMNSRIAELRKEIFSAFNGAPPKVSSLRFASTSSVWFYGDNSMPQYVLEKLGLQSALPQAATQWGVTRLRIKHLKTIEKDIVLYFTPFAKQEELEESIIWNALPFVRNNLVNGIEPCWTYGGALSQLHLAEAMAKSILDIAESRHAAR